MTFHAQRNTETTESGDVACGDTVTYRVGVACHKSVDSHPAGHFAH
jgi:hypothetical protein